MTMPWEPSVDCVFVFFSSRRRHTRFDCDWSSDVCSSDLPAIRERVQAGVPYLGASAGSNVAGPTILTTNDWNVVALDRFDALGLVAFNINPHYKEMDPAMAPYSETRDDRIREYHVVNANPVAGLQGGAWPAVRGGGG